MFVQSQVQAATSFKHCNSSILCIRMPHRFCRQFTAYCEVDILIGGRDVAFWTCGPTNCTALAHCTFTYSYSMEADQITITNEKQMQRGQTVDIDQDKMI